MEEGEIEKPEDASKYLGYVASETLAKYGVDRLPRTVAPDSPERRARNASAEDDDEAEEGKPAGRAEPLNPFRVINDGLQRLRNRE